METRHALGEPLQDHRGPVKALKFSPDGATLASGAWDFRIVLWDVASRRTLGWALTGHEGGVEVLLYTANSKQLISSGLDDTVIIWNVDVGSWKERACNIANRNMTCPEWEQFFNELHYRSTCVGLPSSQACSPKFY